ncbi:hypothetical protein SAMN02745121_01358 [Nannocystis exedens]|uniref:Uncharacterized protein n=1 Tax=Nannocystis exedens TaxID=54 RepID=A0A1I1UWS9_9BACT|nr:hypothetical protein NAEX_05228 [Nannocystis exedens]SFD75144.1 hypothetical protein SAMN02745121_01358 [Nannocystis exedens]
MSSGTAPRMAFATTAPRRRGMVSASKVGGWIGPRDPLAGARNRHRVPDRRRRCRTPRPTPWSRPPRAEEAPAMPRRPGGATRSDPTGRGATGYRRASGRWPARALSPSSDPQAISAVEPRPHALRLVDKREPQARTSAARSSRRAIRPRPWRRSGSTSRSMDRATTPTTARGAKENRQDRRGRGDVLHVAVTQFRQHRPGRGIDRSDPTALSSTAGSGPATLAGWSCTSLLDPRPTVPTARRRPARDRHAGRLPSLRSTGARGPLSSRAPRRSPEEP